MGIIVQFDSVKRAADIAAKLARQNGYGLYTTQALQRDAVRYMERHGVTPEVAARHCVRGPREPMFGGEAA